MTRTLVGGLFLSLIALSAPVQAEQELMLSALEEPGHVLHPGAYRLDDVKVLVDNQAEPRVGRSALRLSGIARGPGAKGDFQIVRRVPGTARTIGFYCHLSPDANVDKVGLQVHDSEGETLMALVPADWEGWQRLQFNLADADFRQSYPQDDKNVKVDLPLNSVNVVWFASEQGPTHVTIDGLDAVTELGPDPNRPAVDAQLIFPSHQAPDEPLAGQVLITNYSDQPQTVSATLSLQIDSHQDDRPLPDPALGSDHALGARSWTEAGGEIIAENTLTDGVDYTAASTAYKTDHWDESEQYLELSETRTITSMKWLSGDANWVWLVDVEASTDGVHFEPVPGLQDVDLHKRWGWNPFDFNEPFAAKVIRFRYHNHGEKSNVIRMPSALSVFDGTDDEAMTVPPVGDEVATQTLDQTVDANSYALVPITLTSTLPTGSYRLNTQVTVGDKTFPRAQAIYVEPTPMAHVGPESRFGLNASNMSLAQEHRLLGIGYVRFENFKWPMVSDSDSSYDFTGNVKPWVVNIDKILETYREAGLTVMPMMFLTPEWAARDLDQAANDRMRITMPPRDNALFGQFAFQSAARYGSKKIPDDQLLTTDKASGKGLLSIYELGNEPDLNPKRNEKMPTWGPWSGTMAEYWPMFREGAMAVKRADPGARVASPGFAGMSVETVDPLRRVTYDDGTRPLDYCDIISVHFYSGRVPPEVATRDANNSTENNPTLAEQLKRLVIWRDENKPEAEIWMTETGYDTGGPIGTNERTQAARLPRVVALCLAHGLDKVIVYRESGSKPSQHAAAGVLRDNLSRKPSWYTYATLIRQLDGTTTALKLPTTDENTQLYLWERNAEPMLMAWAVTGSAVLPVELGSVTVTDAFGHTSKVAATSGHRLSEFPIYLSDIQQTEALEPLVEQAEEREREWHEKRHADAVTEMLLIDFGAAQEPATMSHGKVRYFQTVPADLRYASELGYGFTDAPDNQNDFKHYLKRPIDRHGVSMLGGGVFQLDLEPGNYDITLAAEPARGVAHEMTLRAGGQSETMTVKRSSQHTAQMRVDADGLQLASENPILLKWLMATRLNQ